MKCYLTILLLAATNYAAAQSFTTHKPVECANAKAVIQELISENYQENPVWAGVQPGAAMLKYSLFVNQQTKAWTFIQFDEQVACVLGSGQASTQIVTGTKI
jgi:hypothetical protein